MWLFSKLDKATGYKRIPSKTFKSIPWNCKKARRKIGCTEYKNNWSFIQDNAPQKLEITRDNNEQYSLGLCIRIHGIEYNEDNVKFDSNEIDWMLYFGKPVCDTESKQKVRSIIVKFEGTVRW